jgi:heme exporter protein B
VCALLASMLSVGQLFAGDMADGSLEQMLLAPASAIATVAAKCSAHWLLTGLPLILAAPLAALVFNMSAPALQALVFGLVLGTPILNNTDPVWVSKGITSAAAANSQISQQPAASSQQPAASS